jgi:hypothetical protein
MPEERYSRPGLERSRIYQIRIEGHLGRHWTGWFEGFVVTLEANEETLLTGTLVDQAALYGALKKVRDSGLVLISVNLLRSDHGVE